MQLISKINVRAGVRKVEGIRRPFTYYSLHIPLASQWYTGL